MASQQDHGFLEVARKSNPSGKRVQVELRQWDGRGTKPAIGVMAGGPLFASLTMISGQGVTVEFDHLDEGNRACAAAARFLAELFEYVANMRDDGNLVALDLIEANIQRARVSIAEPDIAFVEHYFAVDLIDDYRKITNGTCAKCGATMDAIRDHRFSDPEPDLRCPKGCAS